MDVQVRRNGSFAISFGSVRLDDCYPGIDGRNIRPIGVRIEKRSHETTIFYDLDVGSLRLVLCCLDNRQDGSGKLEIRTTLSGFLHKPMDVCPVFHAALSGQKGIFIQTLGLRGEYGYFDDADIRSRNSRTDSYGTTGIKGEPVSISVAAADHTRYNNIYSYEPSFNGQGSLFSAGFQMEQTRNGDIELPAICFMESEHLADALSLAAHAIATAMSARRPREKPVILWSSWYYRFHFMTETVLADYLEQFPAMETPPPFDYIQIDAGYCRSPGDWLDFNEQWPDGIQAGFDRIKQAGYQPGIWIAPFVVGNGSSLYRNHPDWVIHDLDGNPLIEKKCYEWSRPWLSFDTEYYILDSSHPDASAYLLDVFRFFKQAGARMFKTDFMLWGMADSSKVRRCGSGKTSVEHLREFLAKIREAIGEDSYWLACIAPFMPFISFADGMRVGGDVVSFWGGEHVRRLASKYIGANYFNHVYWQNDPDVMILRDFDSDLAWNEVQSFSIFQAFTGGISGISDPIFRTSQKVQELFRFLAPAREIRPVFPFFGQKRDDVVGCYSENGLHIVLICNFNDYKMTKKYILHEMLPVPSAYLYEAIHQTIHPGRTEEFFAEIEPRSCLLFYCSEQVQLTQTPSNLWG